MDTYMAIPLLPSPISALYIISSLPFQLLHFQLPSLRVTISRHFASLVPLPHYLILP